jgi:multidrug resistance protein MdtO
MASVAQPIPESPSNLAWIRDFLREELSPFPGRVALVTRMTIAATIIMLLCVTFKIPYGFQGAIYTMFITRESPRATVKSSAIIFAGTLVTSFYVLFSAYLVIDLPELHFFWVIGSLFLAFYLLSAMTNYATALVFAVIIAVALPIWDQHVSAGANVEQTLWVVLVMAIAVLVTSAVELILGRRKPGDEIVLPLLERLQAIEALLNRFAETGEYDDACNKKIVMYGIRGTSLLRRRLRRSEYSDHYKAQMNSVIALVGRLVDTVGAMSDTSVYQFSQSDRPNYRTIAAEIATIRLDLANRRIPKPVDLPTDESQWAHTPLLREMENVIALIPQAFADSESLSEYVPPAGESNSPFFFKDAFSSTRHAKFAFKGCLAAGGCYVIYSAIDWQGISTSVTTCLLTALTTIGSSRQKQVLRFAGAVVGGFGLGMGAQIFILPYVDSIFGFTLLFIAVTALSSWLATCSPRISYFGIQMGFAFYLVNLQEFAIVTSLATARDRVVGVLLGLFMMWLVFDQLWGKPAAVEMRAAFVNGLRLIAEAIKNPVPSDRRTAMERALTLREAVSENFDSVRTLADGVLLEFGPLRQENLEWRRRILNWQSRLRTLFLTRMAIWKYRVRLQNFELPDEVLQVLQGFDTESGKVLQSAADRVDGKPSAGTENFRQSFEQLQQVCERTGVQQPQYLPQVRALISLSRRSENLTRWLNDNI